MKSLLKFKRSPKPFLAPLGAQPRFPRLSRETFDRLPPAAAPVAVTLVGGLALVVILGTFLGREAATSRTEQATPVSAEQVAALPEPAAQPEPAAAVAMEPAADETPPMEEQPAIGGIAADPLPEAPALEPDPGRTASILPALSDVGAFMPAVPVAETDEELAALEAIQRREVEADVGPPSEEATASIGPAEATPMQPATTTQYVNMRAGPDDNAEVLEVVPALASIEAETDCNWCAVAYEGRSGYIYRTFLSYE